MDFGETFPIKNSSFKEFTLFLFDINQRHGQNGKSGTICPLLSKSNFQSKLIPFVQLKVTPSN